MICVQSYEKVLKCRNEQPSVIFEGFLGVGGSSGGSWRLSWGFFRICFGRFWHQDDVFCASWHQTGEKYRQDEPT